MIEVGEARWGETLPHVVATLAGEWLPGLLLRCDAANGWPAGATARLVGEAGVSAGTLARPGYLMDVRAWDLDRLATVLAQSPDAIARTTFRPRLARLQRADARGGPGRPWSLGPAALLRICPSCVAADHLLGWWLAIPPIGLCPRHAVLLHSRCTCGALFAPFRRASVPFVCVSCGRP